MPNASYFVISTLSEAEGEKSWGLRFLAALGMINAPRVKRYSFQLKIEKLGTLAAWTFPVHLAPQADLP